MQVLRREVQLSGAKWGPPSLQPLPGQGCPQGSLSPYTEPPSNSSTGSLQSVCSAKFKVLGGEVLLPPQPPTPTHTHSSKLLATEWSPRPEAAVLGNLGAPLLTANTDLAWSWGRVAQGSPELGL